MPPLLSICIPTYQRRDSVCALVQTILQLRDPIQVCVHVDGSTDGTYETLAAIQMTDRRLLVSKGPNAGRANSLRTAFEAAQGKFVMFYDDDDEIFLPGLAHLLSRLRAPLPAGVCGYIFEMTDQQGAVRGPRLPERSNFLRLRADEGVVGDKKEVVDRQILAKNFYEIDTGYRRVPTSTLWAKLALDFDVLGDNTPLGRKDYLEGGYTSRIHKLKAENPRPMITVNRYRAAGYIRARYRSIRYFARAVLGVLLYSAKSVGCDVLDLQRSTSRRSAPLGPVRDFARRAVRAFGRR